MTTLPPIARRRRDRDQYDADDFAAMTEKALTVHAVESARRGGWLCVHQASTGRLADTPGNPDLLLTHHRRGTLHAELKTGDGRLDHKQRLWLQTLYRAGSAVVLIRPSLMPAFAGWLETGDTTAAEFADLHAGTIHETGCLPAVRQPAPTPKPVSAEPPLPAARERWTITGNPATRHPDSRAKQQARQRRGERLRAVLREHAELNDERHNEGLPVSDWALLYRQGAETAVPQTTGRSTLGRAETDGLAPPRPWPLTGETAVELAIAASRLVEWQAWGASSDLMAAKGLMATAANIAAATGNERLTLELDFQAWRLRQAREMLRSVCPDLCRNAEPPEPAEPDDD